MFLCRQNELEELNDRYANGEFECMIIYGRRRVGIIFTLMMVFCMVYCMTVYTISLNAGALTYPERYQTENHSAGHYGILQGVQERPQLQD